MSIGRDIVYDDTKNIYSNDTANFAVNRHYWYTYARVTFGFNYAFVYVDL